MRLIESLLDFTSSDGFYFLQILKRKKENPEVSSTHNNKRCYVVFICNKRYITPTGEGVWRKKESW